MGNTNSRLVYSTDGGARNCIQETRGRLAVRYETAGRKGKGVTVINGLPLSQAQLDDLAKKLKTRLGTGGTVKDHAIELQGDHRKTISGHLEALGVRAGKK